MNYIQETIELLIYLKDMSYNGTHKATYDFIKKLYIIQGTRSLILNYF